MIDLPFFDDRHRELLARARAAAAEIEPLAARGESGDVDGAAREAMRICAAHRLCELLVDRKYGGGGLDLRALCIAREALAGASALADSVFAVAGLGSYPLTEAPESLAERYLTAIARGRAVAAFALTEVDAGSDVSALKTRAMRHGDEYVIDGSKTFISNATIADFFVVFARTSDAPKRSISAFVVDAAAPGLSLTPLHVSSPHPIADVKLDGCRVPVSHRLGEEGTGVRVALSTLDFFRASVGAAACGLAARALAEARRHALSRVQFGSRLADFQLTQAALADMATELDAARLLVYRAAWLKDSGRPRITREAAMAKLFATETAQQAVDVAIQVHGARALEEGHLLEHLYREVRAPRIYEGASEVQREIIARELFKETV